MDSKNPDSLFMRAYIHFESLMSSLGKRDGEVFLFKDLFFRYSQPHRFYHTLSHVVAMLDEFEGVSSLSLCPNEVRMAIWYHDAVYDSNPSSFESNEEKSAKLAREHLSSFGFEEEFIDLVCELIMATSHNNEVKQEHTDSALIRDLDLAILGKDPDIFDHYEELIRKEYSFVSDDNYKKGRKKIIEYFLACNPLYKTYRLRQKYEEKAKENLRKSLSKLG